MSTIAAVGDKDTVLAFRAMGVETHFATRATEIREAIIELEKRGVSLIFIPEAEAVKVEEFLRTYDAVPYPVILTIQDGREEGGFAIQKIIKNMERAVGSSASLRNTDNKGEQ